MKKKSLNTKLALRKKSIVILTGNVKGGLGTIRETCRFCTEPATDGPDDTCNNCVTIACPPSAFNCPYTVYQCPETAGFTCGG